MPLALGGPGHTKEEVGIRIVIGLLSATVLVALLSVAPVQAQCGDSGSIGGGAGAGKVCVSVPEPGTALLLGAGVLLAGEARLRYKK